MNPEAPLPQWVRIIERIGLATVLAIWLLMRADPMIRDTWALAIKQESHQEASLRLHRLICISVAKNAVAAQACTQ